MNMKNIIEWFIKYPKWADIIKILIMGFGLLALLNMKSSFFAELENNFINIQILYPGASPEEIELGVVNKIETNLKGIQGIDRYTSRSTENSATISIETFRSYDIDEVYQEVKNAVDRIAVLPVGIESIVVARAPSTEFAVSFGIYGQEDLHSLKAMARQIEYDLRAIPGVSQIEIVGLPDEEIVVYLNSEEMSRYGISFDEVSNALRSANIDVSLGSIKTDKEELLIRLMQREYYAEPLQDIVVRTDGVSRTIRLRDIAEITNTWEESPQQTYINGKRGVIFNISKIIGENILDISNDINKYVEDFQTNNENFRAEIIDDSTLVLRGRISLLLKNGAQGVMLVLLSLAMFLNFRLAFWVALSIPFSFLGMFLIGSWLGLTVNALSLFGCIVVVGILVDDGIVVAEQIYQYYEKGKKPFDAAIEGTLEVLPSIFFAATTTITAFMPFFFLDGRQGASMKDLGIVVIFSIVFSLIEAAIILPSHLAHSKALREKKKNPFREKFEKILLYPRDVLYTRSLKFFMEFKYLVFIITIGITFITLGGFSGGIIKATFFPVIDNDSFTISLNMPPGTREQSTLHYLDIIEKATWEVNEELKNERDDKEQVVLKTVKTVGSPAFGFRGGASGFGQSSEGSLIVVLMDGELRNYESFKISNRIRDKVGPILEADEVIYGEGSIFGKPIAFSMLSPNLSDLENAKEELKAGLNSMSEVDDITDNDPKGLREIKLTLKPQAQILGFTNFEIAKQIRQGFFGDEVQRLQRGEDEIKVWVRYSLEDRSGIGQLENIKIRTNQGDEYPLTELVDYSIERGSVVINHINGFREVTIQGDIVDKNAEVPPILAEIEEQYLNPILAKYPSISLAESGQKREIMKMARTARSAMTAAFIFIFFWIVLSFRSYMQAVLVIALIPLGFIGAVWGHYFMGMPVNIFSAYGMLALIGIIVNDSIVMVNTYNKNLRSGMQVKEAIYEASINRFRPVLLTTLTTVLGLFPLLMERSLQAQFLIPMAISVSFGLLFSSFFILMFLPVFILYGNSFKRRLKWLITGEMPHPSEVESAVVEQNRINRFME